MQKLVRCNQRERERERKKGERQKKNVFCLTCELEFEGAVFQDHFSKKKRRLRKKTEGKKKNVDAVCGREGPPRRLPALFLLRARRGIRRRGSCCSERRKHPASRSSSSKRRDDKRSIIIVGGQCLGAPPHLDDLVGSKPAPRQRRRLLRRGRLAGLPLAARPALRAAGDAREADERGQGEWRGWGGGRRRKKTLGFFFSKLSLDDFFCSLIVPPFFF